MRRAAALLVLAAGACAPARAAPRATAQAPAGSPSSAARVAADSPLFACTTVKVAEGVYAFLPPEPHGPLVTGNSVLVVGDDGALVVDTGHFPSLARRAIDEIRRITDRPVRYVVNTHWHPDHLVGNAVYRDAYPGVVLLAHDETRRLALLRAPQYVDQQRGSQALLDRIHEVLRTGMRKGQPITAEQRELAVKAIEAIEQTLGDSDVTLVAPTETFTGEVTVHLGRREVRVMHLGRGNTAGDVVVYVPDAGVVATGDLVVAPTPYGYDSYPAEWVATLKRLAALGATTLVPGHGPVQHDMTYVNALVELIESVRSQTADAVKQGLSLEETRKRVDLEPFRRRFAGDDLDRSVAFKVSFAEPFVERAYQEAHGQLAPE